MNIETPHRAGIASVLWFLTITFTATYGLEIALINGGLRFDADVIQSAPALWLLAVMWIPGLAALFVATVIEGASLKDLVKSLSLRMGSIGPYLLTFLIAPLAFAAMYGLSWAMGWSTPDLTLSTLSQATGSSESITQETVFKVMLPLSIVIGPLINFVFGLGEELGWRGFLLPRLLQFGRIKAHLILGILWGLWHAPLIWAGFNYPGSPVAGIITMCVLCLAFGIFLNEMTLHYRSCLLAAFIHGAVNAQGFGVWAWMFPDIDPLLGGGTGLTGIVIWLIVGALTIPILSRLKAQGN